MHRFVQKRRPRAALLVVGCALWLAPAMAAAATPDVGAGADPAPRAPRAEAWDVQGEAGFRVLGASNFGTDTHGTRTGQTSWTQSRLIAGAKWAGERLGLELEVEALNGTTSGDGLRLGTAYSRDVFLYPRDGRSQQLQQVLPRKALLTWNTPVGRVLLGPQVFQWGLGLLAHDGRTGSDFGDPRQGNVVGRAAFATQPFRSVGSAFWRTTAIFLGGDYVLRDDNANVLDGDVAMAAVLGARAQTDRAALGLFVAARDQTDRKDPWRPDGQKPRTSVVAVDLYGRRTVQLGAGQRLHAEAEGAVILGRSDRPYSEETLGGVDVASVGAVGRLRLQDDALRLTAKLEAGYASGDNDPRDGKARAFAFHSDYNVGLVLWKQVLPALAARGIDRLADPNLLAQRPPSLRYAVNQGAVSNAVYLQPTVRWRPLAALDVRLGYLLAATAGRFSDPYQSGMNGGYPTTPGGKSNTTGLYGHEVDASVRYDIALPGRITLRVGAEAGVLVPGAVFDGVAGLGNPWLTRGLVDVLW